MRAKGLGNLQEFVTCRSPERVSAYGNSSEINDEEAHALALILAKSMKVRSHQSPWCRAKATLHSLSGRRNNESSSTPPIATGPAQAAHAGLSCFQ